MAEEIGEFISMTEFARRMKCTVSAVVKAINNGRIERCADKTIYWPTQSVAWEKNRKTSAVRGGVVRHAPKEVMEFIHGEGNSSEEDYPSDDDEDDDGQVVVRKKRRPFAPSFGPDPYADPEPAEGSLGSARLRKENAMAGLRELELLKESGMVVNKEMVLRARFIFCRTVRDAILNIPERVSSEVGANISQYLEALITSTVGREVADTILARLDLSDVERVVKIAWTKESRNVLSNVREFETSDIDPQPK